MISRRSSVRASSPGGVGAAFAGGGGGGSGSGDARVPRRQSMRIGDAPRRMPDSSPVRQSHLPLEVKESISGMVRAALRPHWHKHAITSDQFATINRDVSRKLYEAAEEMMPDEEARRRWEQLAAGEVDRAVANIKALAQNTN